MRGLEQLIARCNVEYYIQGKPSLSDAAFDETVKQLRQLEESYPDLVSSASPLRRVLQPLDKALPAVPHNQPMLSLENLTSAEDVNAFLNTVFKKHTFSTPSVHFSIEPKVDGLSAAWHYEYGELVRVLTRGDGINGEDITAAARTIHEMPLRLHDGELAQLQHVEIRGEIYMRRSVLRRLNASREEPFANTRNAAVGSIKLKDPRQVAERCLSFAGYDIVGMPPTLENAAHVGHWLRQAGVPLCPFNEVHAYRSSDTIASIVAHMHARIMAFDTVRQGLDMDTDGCVVKLVMAAEARKELGHNGRVPLWAAAYKYPPEEACTELLGVTFQIGKHGTVTPVAELKPVKLAGSVISRATLHNLPRMTTLGLTRGCTVVIAKAGEIIPQVLRVSHHVNPVDVISAPKECPVCNSPLTSEEGVVAVRCGNSECEGTVAAKLKHAISKAALNVESVGPAVIDELVQQGGVRRLSQLFNLDPAKLISAGVTTGVTTMTRWMLAFKDAAERNKDKPEVLLYAMAIKDLGNKACEALVQRHGSVMTMLSLPAEVVYDTPDLGQVAADAWLNVRSQPWFLAELSTFEKLGFQLDMLPQTPTGDKLKGLKFVITGDLSRERGEFQKLIKANGGATAGSVSGKTSHLIAGREPGRTKLAAAAAKGVPVINEEEFWNMLR